MAFKFYDKDGSGSISVDEIKQAIGVGKKVNEEVWNQMVHEVDTNGDGAIDFDEF